MGKLQQEVSPRQSLQAIGLIDDQQGRQIQHGGSHQVLVKQVKTGGGFRCQNHCQTIDIGGQWFFPSRIIGTNQEATTWKQGADHATTGFEGIPNDLVTADRIAQILSQVARDQMVLRISHHQASTVTNHHGSGLSGAWIGIGNPYPLTSLISLIHLVCQTLTMAFLKASDPSLLALGQATGHLAPWLLKAIIKLVKVFCDRIDFFVKPGSPDHLRATPDLLV
ncbi:hypothetical protein CCP4SC76_5240002 [Gammaproteobacteria bacterium]